MSESSPRPLGQGLLEDKKGERERNYFTRYIVSAQVSTYEAGTRVFTNDYICITLRGDTANAELLLGPYMVFYQLRPFFVYYILKDGMLSSCIVVDINASVQQFFKTIV